MVYDRAWEATAEEIYEWLKTSPWGRDYLQCDNDQPDHQVSIMRFEGRPRVVELGELEGGYQGHGGGDWGLVQALYDDMLTVPSPADMTTSIEESAHSHVMAFATEHARLSGKVVDVAEFERRVMNGELAY